MNSRSAEFEEGWSPDRNLKENLITLFEKPFKQYAPREKIGFFLRYQFEEQKEYEEVQRAILHDLRNNTNPEAIDTALEDFYLKFCLSTMYNEGWKNKNGQLFHMSEFAKSKIEEAVPMIQEFPRVIEELSKYSRTKSLSS